MPDVLEELGAYRVKATTIELLPDRTIFDLPAEEPMEAFFKHLVSESEKLDAFEREKLVGCVSDAKVSIQSNNNALSGFYFFLLGITAGNLANPFRHIELVNDALREGFLARVVELERAKPLKARNSRKALAMQAVRRQALLFWQSEEYKNLRVAEMAQVVWNYFSSLEGDWRPLIDEFPDEAAGFKTWLRTIAPESAKKAGRPKPNQKI